MKVHVMLGDEEGKGSGPSLDYSQFQRHCHVLHFQHAIAALDNSTAISFFAQVKFLSKAGSKILQSIRDNLDGMHWERPRMRVLDPNYIDPEENLQDMEIPVRGMDIARLQRKT
ncbi:p-hydroxybenzoic acid efflux pump subunit aaeB [Senna tora]|uniref:p-hydroxybenzoic acid efflux pump subunit aaeB n=1 Tax=Senna tora TaxID=362788 RepID=A0A834WF01_9FABA|nr:p-hydroxybenzoic acid efflux pump subunit aaeB [Senna tora]